MKSALVTGVTGQDGSYLSELLLEKDYEVFGLKRRSSTNTLDRLSKCLNHQNFSIVEGEVADSGCVYEVVNKHKPDEIYNLAAQSHVGSSFEQPDFTFQVNALGPLHLLEAIRRFSPETKFYQASTSEMFGKNYTTSSDIMEPHKYQDEDTMLMPQSPYAVAKTAAHHLVRIYREAYDVFGCCGILFNHESERRGEHFVTRKITKWIGEFMTWIQRHNIKYSDLIFDKDEVYIPGRISNDQGFQFPKLRLGNLEARRDWGHAKDYVKAMWMMLQHDTPDDFVCSMGESHTVKELCEEVFSRLGLDYTEYVRVKQDYLRPTELHDLKGDCTKLKKTLGWKPEYTFKSMMKEMVDARL